MCYLHIGKTDVFTSSRAQALFLRHVVIEIKIVLICFILFYNIRSDMTGERS